MIADTNIKFTVVIPTRERADVLYHCMRTVLAQDYDRLEVLVSDNDSKDHTKDVVASFRDPRIRYTNTGRRVSMSDNWEHALSQIVDGWVSVIGDDDGLLPGALGRVANLITDTDVQMIRSNGCGYMWPSRTKADYGRLTLSMRKGYEIRSPRKWMSRALKAREHYSNLPMLYTGGFVSHTVMKHVKSITGRMYLSMTPDVYSAFAFGSLIDHYGYSYEPFAINGGSKYGTGDSSRTATNPSLENDSPAATFLSEKNIPFHPDLSVIPELAYPPSIQAVVYEAYLQSAALRSGSIALTSYAEQLELILRHALPQHRAQLNKWAQAFANKYHLNLERIERKSRYINPITKLYELKTRAINRFYTIVAGSEEFPIVNVYEASLIAHHIKTHGFNKIDRARLLSSSLIKRRAFGISCDAEPPWTER